MHPYIHSSTIHNSQDMGKPKCPSTDEWIKEMWYICTMEYYSAIKKNEIMPFAATRRQIEIIILSEVSQKEKDKYHLISLVCGYYLNTESKIWQNGNVPGSPVVNTSPCMVGGVVSIPGWGTKIPHDLWPKNQNIKQRQYCNNSVKTLKMVHVKKKNLQNMTQMNLSTKQKQTHGHREQTCACQVGGVSGGWG